MTPKEKRADEVVAACLLANRDGIDARSVILIALLAAERRGEERVLRWLDRHGWALSAYAYRQEHKSRRARGGKR